MEPIGILNDGQIFDLQTAEALNIVGDTIKADDSNESLEILRHSTAHLMAQAIKELYPEAKFFVGPVVNEGFYYDFKVNNKISDEDLPKIEKKMKELADRKLPITRHETSREEFYEKFKNDELKQAVLKNIKDEVITVYKQGDFEDLCRGPHLPNTRMIRSFKLTRVAGAYLGGDEKNEMITRIYGISFFDKKALNDYITMLEEAKKRDHRKLGTELELFTFNDEVGAGLPLWLPNGARLRSKLEHLLYKAHRVRGYEPVRGPEILKADMWRTSGHYANYKENMYFTTIDEQEYGIKPMNCVGHIQIFDNDLVSYKELPKKFFEYGVVHRHELSGAMHGLFRVREFTQDDAHIFCTQNQIKDVIFEVLEFVDSLLKLFDFKYEIEVSTKPEKAIGDDIFWETTTKAIMNALDEKNISYGIDEGGGAFYGPKIDIKILDAIGRKWQCGTVQIDMNLPSRFNISYINEKGEKEQPVMIHRAILGSFERFIGILTEHCAGEFPFAIAPTQVIFIPIAEPHVAYAKELQKELIENDLDSSIYDMNESLNKRIRMAEKQRVPMLVILGDEELANKTVALRDRRKREQSNLSKDEFLQNLINILKGSKI
ncbi:threonine--tRNA ligase [Aliarcobacter thereius]|uniref:Threonine--tRNA ligase n=2 Tax=Aliarcobacter thereius TaxID=544718 RepID=A0A1C0B9P1_9BACT|nr:threonine--tRNA ligase [Aliarcobacter thereius]OCL92041.1 Threonine--tRNA ligase 2 [Aliarcobacter thereius]OCL94863.1 Threonine--tRNA ligase 2 [Aliarcobacter thereius LMG 24486]OCM00310.1 Threonine--tRNA ligase 2 [Aliarcobacter thereius]QBF15263.1 threonyl-tRNA synthetase [Aliarcobacter thereius LMG 24486]TLS72515.1 threonine--tRNA ligase [Aliarcobacter thereius]